MGHLGSSVGQIPYSQEDREIIRRELALILDSPQFRGSRRCQDFLTHVVTQALEGHADALKERGLAVEVFGRKADAGLDDDSIVRVGAREVRKRLAQYYMAAGSADRVRIELPPGSYVPVFQRSRAWRPPSRPSSRFPPPRHGPGAALDAGFSSARSPRLLSP